jgi:hypothetical protein
MTGELILALTAILIAAVLVWFWLADDIAAFREEHRPFETGDGRDPLEDAYGDLPNLPRVIGPADFPLHSVKE